MNAVCKPKLYLNGIDLTNHLIFVNENQFVRLHFPDIFSDYLIIRDKDKSSLPNKLFVFIYLL